MISARSCRKRSSRMRRLILVSFLALPFAACQSSRTSLPQYPQPVALTVPTGAQSVTIAASPEIVREALIVSANERGTAIIQNDPNMIVLETLANEENPALDENYGPSNNGNRKFGVRIRFQGTNCNTFAVQEVYVTNNAGTALEQKFTIIDPKYNSRDALIRLKNRAESASTCGGVIAG